MLLTRQSMPRKFAVLALTATSLLVFNANSAAQEERKVLAHPTPAYPEVARKYGVTGVVKVQVLIAPDGHIKETKIIGGHPMLVASVQETLKGWKYAPASAESTVLLDFNFHAQNDAIAAENNSEKGKR